MSVLIVEDDPLMALMIRDIVRSLRHIVVGTARDEEQAVRKAEECHPDLIILDMSLESGTGLSALQRIMVKRSVSYFFITADPDCVRAALPAATVIHKPARISEITGEIQRISACLQDNT
jgi:chemotaxis response regulator CheB